MKQMFSPISLGAIALANRLVMAPMTRSRAGDDGVPAAITTTYYAQRATAGMIVTEGVFPSAIGKGYVHTPGIVTAEQAAAWKQVTDGVHAQGGRIVMQLMHCGRISHPTLLDGATPVAPSAIKPEGQAWTSAGQVDYVTPRALTLEEIAATIADYRQATRRALDAGFDGVELHAASGYLPEQFLSSGSNQRQDGYGGSVENRARFIVEVLAAMVAEAGADRVGIKISPEMNYNSISDADPAATYRYLVETIAGMGLAYLHVALFGQPATDYHALLRPLFDGAYLHGSGLTRDSAAALLEDGKADAVVFGAAFLANPDLPQRFRDSAALNAPDHGTFFAPPTAQGYIDYPTLAGIGAANR